MIPYQYSKPKNIKEALKDKKKAGKFIAGGTNLVDLMKKEISEPNHLVDITNALPDTIQSSSRGIRLGAMATNSAVADHQHIQNNYPLIKQAILAGATPQIRNMASTGGNLLQRTRCPYFYDTDAPCNKREPGTGCGAKNGKNRMMAVVGYSEDCVAVHPSDFCVALAALDAVVHIRDQSKKRFPMRFTDFHRLPGKKPWIDNNLPQNALIEFVEIPANDFQEHSAYIKVRDRESYAFALISVAAAFSMSGNKIKEARLASGGVAHKPWRWYKAEKYLTGKTATENHFKQAAKLAAEEVTPLEKNQFKKEMLRGAIVTALQECLQNKNS